MWLLISYTCFSENLYYEIKSRFEFLEIFSEFIMWGLKRRRQPCRNMATVSSPAQFLSWLLVAPEAQMCTDVLNFNVFIVLTSEFTMTCFEFY